MWIVDIMNELGPRILTLIMGILSLLAALLGLRYGPFPFSQVLDDSRRNWKFTLFLALLGISGVYWAYVGGLEVYQGWKPKPNGPKLSLGGGHYHDGKYFTRIQVSDANMSDDDDPDYKEGVYVVSFRVKPKDAYKGKVFVHGYIDGTGLVWHIDKDGTTSWGSGF